MSKSNSILLFSLLFVLKLFGQKECLSFDLQQKYFNAKVKVGILDSKLNDSLRIINRSHPIRFYEMCENYYKENMLNEATVLYFIARTRYKIYNESNPSNEASGDGALSGSMAAIYGIELSKYFNSNLDNFAYLLKFSADWMNKNEYLPFNNGIDKEVYHRQAAILNDILIKLTTNQIQYIIDCEVEQKAETEVIKRINEMNEVLDEFSEEDEEFVDDVEMDGEELNQETEPEMQSDIRPTSTTPEGFLSNYNGDFFIVNKENKISAVAHGYYNTKLEVKNGLIKSDGSNPLHYLIIPEKIGECNVIIYGLTESGKQVCLGMYTFEVRDK